MNIVYLQLGSNKGNRKNFLQEAMSYIEKMIGHVEKESGIYETSPWRVENQTNYLNQVILIRSPLSVSKILKKIIYIENIIGRVRTKKWAPREIDIDILFFNQEIISTENLCIPHKFLHERLFVLVPLNDIAPNFVHPLYHKNISDLLDICPDKEEIKEHEI